MSSVRIGGCGRRLPVAQGAKLLGRSRPLTLAGAPGSDQGFRIEVIDPAALFFSLAKGDLLGTVFRTVDGDSISMEPTEVTFDLSPWGGLTVRLRLALVPNRVPFFAAIDDIQIERSG